MAPVIRMWEGQSTKGLHDTRFQSKPALEPSSCITLSPTQDICSRLPDRESSPQTFATYSLYLF
jgi:hypothetical protein